jgi:hypothetical protein
MVVMKRGWWFVAAFAPFALGCASSVPVECPEGFGLSVDGVECEPVPFDERDAGPEPLDEPDGGDVEPLSTCRDADCDDGNECTVDGCDGDQCASAPVEDGAACVFEDGAGICDAGACVRDCEIEDCREVYPCTEQGLRDAIEDGGEVVIGCNGPTTVFLENGELDMFKDVSIDGLGLLTVDAQGMSRVFVANETASITLIGMDITGGNAATEEEHSGGGVFAGADNEVTLRNCNVYGNASSIHGGGVRVSGKLTIESCSISFNTAVQRGGGIAVWSEARIVDSVIADNEATTDGGGMYVTSANAVVTIENSVIERNRTPESGGGIWSAGALILDGTIVRDNVSGNAGGGIRTYGTGDTRTGTLVTRNGTVFANNVAVSGGAIATYQVAPEIVTISDTELTGNSTTEGSGGAIFNDETPLEVVDSVFEGNHAASTAGAVYSKRTDTVFRRTTFSDHEAKQGGAFRFLGNNTARIDGLFENCTISNSRSTEPGGTFLNRNATVWLIHATLTDSIAGTEGSGIHLIEGAEIHSRNSVIDAGCYADPDSLLISLGYNGVLTPETEQCVLNPVDGAGTDILLSSEEMALAPLSLSRGSTPAHVPGAGSVLIDAIPAESCVPDLDHDQRGEPRNGMSPCDIGAIEVQPGE